MSCFHFCVDFCNLWTNFTIENLYEMEKIIFFFKLFVFFPLPLPYGLPVISLQTKFSPNAGIMLSNIRSPVQHLVVHILIPCPIEDPYVSCMPEMYELIYHMMHSMICTISVLLNLSARWKTLQSKQVYIFKFYIFFKEMFCYFQMQLFCMSNC